MFPTATQRFEIVNRFIRILLITVLSHTLSDWLSLSLWPSCTTYLNRWFFFVSQSHSWCSPPLHINHSCSFEPFSFWWNPLINEFPSLWLVVLLSGEAPIGPWGVELQPCHKVHPVLFLQECRPLHYRGNSHMHTHTHIHPHPHTHSYINRDVLQLFGNMLTVMDGLPSWCLLSICFYTDTFRKHKMGVWISSDKSLGSWQFNVCVGGGIAHHTRGLPVMSGIFSSPPLLTLRMPAGAGPHETVLPCKYHHCVCVCVCFHYYLTWLTPCSSL